MNYVPVSQTEMARGTLEYSIVTVNPNGLECRIELQTPIRLTTWAESFIKNEYLIKKKQNQFFFLHPLAQMGTVKQLSV